ncbi:DivIVA domain-containing protein [Gordonia sp. (in: high G+C Gram-positive bacteria)]|uniref:DivIVA domain-containing protein n=1 Tax=Gordonia sp. (in: high G+C Gram-positive bacteria) TaxID=84139 RepID=UPI0039E5D80E
MLMILSYTAGVLVAAGLLFLIAWFVFGRGEDLAPLDDEVTVTELPRAGITGADVRALRFGLVFRGYRQSEVDWALEKLAREIDELRSVTDALRDRAETAAGPGHAPPDGGGPAAGPQP